LHRLAAAGFTLLAACGDDTATPLTDSGGPDDVGVDTTTPFDASKPETGPCNALVLSAAPVTDHVVYDAQAPVPDGGPVSPGLYFLTDVSVYLTSDAGAPPLGTRQEVHAFDDGGIWQMFDGTGTRLSLVFAVEGATLHRIVICPEDIKTKDGPFTGSDTALSLFDYNAGVTTIFTLTKQ
jgi:hypothetical protein